MKKSWKTTSTECCSVVSLHKFLNSGKFPIFAEKITNSISNRNLLNLEKTRQKLICCMTWFLPSPWAVRLHHDKTFHDPQTTKDQHPGSLCWRTCQVLLSGFWCLACGKSTIQWCWVRNMVVMSPKIVYPKRIVAFLEFLNGSGLLYMLIACRYVWSINKLRIYTWHDNVHFYKMIEYHAVYKIQGKNLSIYDLWWRVSSMDLVYPRSHDGPSDSLPWIPRYLFRKVALEFLQLAGKKWKPYSSRKCRLHLKNSLKSWNPQDETHSKIRSLDLHHISWRYVGIILWLHFWLFNSTTDVPPTETTDRVKSREEKGFRLKTHWKSWKAPQVPEPFVPFPSGTSKSKLRNSHLHCSLHLLASGRRSPENPPLFRNLKLRLSVSFLGKVHRIPDDDSKCRFKSCAFEEKMLGS